MRKAIVLSDSLIESGLIRKTVLVEDRTNPSAVTYRGFVVVCDAEGMLQESYEIPFETSVPGSDFINGHIIPIPAPKNQTILLDINNPNQP
jgi:hypothetical protein